MKIKNIETRRAIRSYTDEIISQEALDNIISAAMNTPTSMGSQPFKLVVVKRGEIEQAEMAKLAYGQVHPQEASHIIFIFTLRRESANADLARQLLSYLPADQIEARIPGTVEFLKHRYDLPGAGYSVATLMALEADANGVGSTIASGLDKEAIEAKFANVVPSNYEFTQIVSLGIKSSKAQVYPKNTNPANFVINYKK